MQCTQAAPPHGALDSVVWGGSAGYRQEVWVSDSFDGLSSKHAQSCGLVAPCVADTRSLGLSRAKRQIIIISTMVCLTCQVTLLQLPRRYARFLPKIDETRSMHTLRPYSLITRIMEMSVRGIREGKGYRLMYATTMKFCRICFGPRCRRAPPGTIGGIQLFLAL